MRKRGVLTDRGMRYTLDCVRAMKEVTGDKVGLDVPHADDGAAVRLRALILEADPEMTEEWKWNNPVWSHHGIVCTGEAYKKVVKLTFAKGASLPDPKRLFNSSLDGKVRRAIDIREGEEVNATAFKALIRRAAGTRPRPA